MKKKKKATDEWTVFINRLMSRKRCDRRYKMPQTYLLALADNIHKTNPTKEILYNTLKEIYSVVFEKCYIRFNSDRILFKAKQEKHLNNEFNKFKDEIDDLIHSKNQQCK